MYGECKASLLELASSLLPHIARARGKLHGLEVHEFFVPWLVEAFEEHWLGEEKIRAPLSDERILYHLVGMQSDRLTYDNYAVILSVQAHHQSLREYEAFTPLFETFVWATEMNMHDCCAFTQAVEGGKASIWRVNGTDCFIRMGAEEHPQLLMHVLSMMISKSGSSGFALLHTSQSRSDFVAS